MKKIILALSVILSSTSVYSQESDDIQEFSNDMLLIARKFAQPAADGAAYQASAGWFSSAVALQKWEFRISLHGNALFIPEEQKSFNLTNQELSLLEIEGASSASFPTAFGTNTTTFISGEINSPLYSGPVRFKGLDGIDKTFVPHAFAQVAVGLSRGTELTLRLMPAVTIDGVTASTYGAGLKHNLSQHFGYHYPEDFQMAIGIAYSRFDVNYEYEPIEVPDFVTMNLVDVKANLFMAEVIGSKRWSQFELFGAAGVMNSEFDYEMGGSGFGLTVINEKLQDLGEAKLQFKGDLGFNLHFGKFRLSSMASFGDFFNANIGVHVRI